MKTQTTFSVRTYECDSYGHVNNAVYLNYLEFARMDYLKQIGFDYEGFVRAGFFIFVSHVDIHYKSSARFGDVLTILSEPIKFGAVSGTIRQVVQNNAGVVCAEAFVTWASVNSASFRPSKIPDEFVVSGLKPDSV